MIDSIKISNFKCFENETIPTKNLNFLTGINAMGKSTTIQSLLLLRQSVDQKIFPGTGLALNGDLVSIGTSKDALCDYSANDEIEISVDFSTLEEPLMVKVRHDIGADVMQQVDAKTPEGYLSQPLFDNNFQYISAERLGPRSFFEMSEYAVRDRRYVGTQGEFTAHFLARFGNDPIPIEGLVQKDTDSNNLIDQVNYWLQFISPGARLEVNAHAAMDIVDVRYAFAREKDMSNLFRCTNVGFGLTYTLPIIVGILGAPKGSLLIFENPETNLHPSGQAKLGRLLSIAAANGVQLIIESHSDHVFNGIRLAVKDKVISPDVVQLCFFDRDLNSPTRNARINYPKLDSDGKLLSLHDGFFDEYEKSLFELL